MYIRTATGVLVACLVLVALAPGCATSTDRHHATNDTWQRTSIYFGRDVRGTDEVTLAQFNNFVDTHHAPHVDGMTIYDASGRYTSDTGHIESERSFVVTLLYPTTTERDTRRAIHTAATAYIARFHQSSVLVEHSASDVQFITE
ncbi:MAG: DUF3574 domain-containing protein [Planctomycetota bacterium]